jgi:hypothetical protein
MNRFLIALCLAIMATAAIAQTYEASGNTYPTRDKLVIKHLVVTSDVILPGGSISNSGTSYARVITNASTIVTNYVYVSPVGTITNVVTVR